MTLEKKRVAILISGRGSNMAKLVEAAAEADFSARIVGVISDVPEAAGLQFAAGRGIAVRSIPRGDFTSREAHDAAIDAALIDMDAEIVALAGYMRLLTARLVERWLGRMINIHPALLPSFKGLNTHRRALDAGARIHGCTVHFVTPEMDDGPIIAQAAVPVMVSDNEDLLAARVLKAEHLLYPLALRLVAEGKAKMQDGRTVFSLRENDKDALGRLFSPAGWDDEIDLEALARFTP